MSGRRRAEILALIVLVGFVVAVGAHYVSTFYMGKAYPFSTFLFKPVDQFDPNAPSLGSHIFGDLYGTWQHTKDGSPYLSPGVFYPSNYLPATHLLLKPLSWLAYPVAAVIFLAGSLITTIILFWRHIEVDDLLSKALLTAVIGCLTYPVLFALDRGNVDMLIFFALWSMIAFILRERWVAAGIALSIAVSMKGLPLLFMILFVQARQWKALWVSATASVGLTFAALITMTGGISANLRALEGSLGKFEAASVTGTNGLQHVTSIAGLLGVLEHYFSWAVGLANVSSFLGVVLLMIVVGAALLLPLELWERITLLAAAVILVPTVTYDYRLTLMLLPVLLILSERQAPHLPVVVPILFGLLLVPKGLPVLWEDVGAGTLVNPLLMLGLVGVVLLQGVARWRRPIRDSALQPLRP